MVFNEKLDTGPDSVSQTGFMFLPHLRVLVTGPGPIRPYIAGMLGYQSISGEANGTTTQEVNDFLYGGGFGFYGMIGDNAAIEPNLNLLGESVTGKAAGVEVTGSSFVLTVGLAFNVWFGSSRRHAADDEGYEEPAPEPSPGRRQSSAFSGPPVKAPPVVDLSLDPNTRLRVSGDAGSDVPMLDALVMGSTVTGDCDFMHWSADSGIEYQIAASASEAERGSQMMSVVRAQIAYSTMVELLNSDETTVETCQGSWQIEPRQRQQLKHLLVQFRKEARQLGTWEAAKAAETRLVGSQPTPESGDQY
jgi:hypothetical protein